jgi:hypothetical protein
MNCTELSYCNLRFSEISFISRPILPLINPKGKCPGILYKALSRALSKVCHFEQHVNLYHVCGLLYNLVICL